MLISGGMPLKTTADPVGTTLWAAYFKPLGLSIMKGNTLMAQVKRLIVLTYLASLTGAGMALADSWPQFAGRIAVRFRRRKGC